MVQDTSEQQPGSAIRAVEIWMYQVPNQNVEILRIVNRITRRHVQLQSSTRWYGTIA